MITQPDNMNTLKENAYRLVFTKIPNVTYFVQTFKLPSKSIGQLQIPLPLYKSRVMSTRQDIGDVELTFLVDENLANYYELYKWMNGIAPTESWDEYKDLIQHNEKPLSKPRAYNIYADAILVVLNNVSQKNYQIQIKDCAPSFLSELNFDYKSSEPLFATMTLTFSDYIIEI